MSTPTGDWSTDLAGKIADLIKNPANFSAQTGVQALLSLMHRRIAELEAKVTRLEQGKTP